MKKFTQMIVMLLVITGAFGIEPQARAQSKATDIDLSGVITKPCNYAPATIIAPLATLFDNGPVFNSTGTGSGGANESIYYQGGSGTYGSGCQLTSGIYIADDFTVPSCRTWSVNTIDFYSYQTNSGNTSTITGIYVRIWSGKPGVAGSTVFWGDLTTNLMASTTFANIYRVLTVAGGTARPVMQVIANTPGLSLNEGTYWIEWACTGSAALTGPWAPPVVTTDNITGNAIQTTDAGVTYNDIAYNAFAQGMPFTLEGTETINNPVPTIIGQNNLCINSGTYDYTTESGMTGYIWTVSPGGIINSGSGTYQINVSWITPGPQNVSVTYSYAGCQALVPTILNVTVNDLPEAAGSVSGTATVCAGSMGVAYSVAPVTGAVTYIWNLPTGASVASGNLTNSITVDYAPNAISGAITVLGNNLCGNGSSSPSYPVTVASLPATAGLITGDAVVCRGMGGVSYSVDPIPNATGYVWTLPAGASIVAGNNTNAITVDFSVTAVSGPIMVYGTNVCGNGNTGTELNITVNPVPPTPIITVIGSNILHSNATTGNQWYFQGTSILGATGQEYTPTQTGEYWCIVTLSGCDSDSSNHVLISLGIQPAPSAAVFVVYPDPNDGRFRVSITCPATETFTMKIYNILSVMVFEIRNIEVKGTTERYIDMTQAPSGIYSVVFENENKRMITKLLINH